MPVGYVLHDVMEWPSLGSSQGMGTYVPLPQGFIVASSELEIWIGLDPQPVLHFSSLPVRIAFASKLWRCVFSLQRRALCWDET